MGLRSSLNYDKMPAFPDESCRFASSPQRRLTFSSSRTNLPFATIFFRLLFFFQIYFFPINPPINVRVENKKKMSKGISGRKKITVKDIAACCLRCCCCTSSNEWRRFSSKSQELDNGARSSPPLLLLLLPRTSFFFSLFLAWFVLAVRRYHNKRTTRFHSGSYVEKRSNAGDYLPRHFIIVGAVEQR